jgi:hypothetical protein
LVTNNLLAQIQDCSECNAKNFTDSDVKDLTLLDLKILRNEIFARHQFAFKNDRLKIFFLEKYDWYKPRIDDARHIKLNQFEQENISLFKKYEKQKEALKKTTIKELISLKKLINSENRNDIKVMLKPIDDGDSSYISAVIAELKTILNKIDLNQIHWFNENGLYKIITDNGHFINEAYISIKSHKIVLHYSEIGSSELLHKTSAFGYDSAYESENEYSTWYYFEIQNNKLKLIKQESAG